MAHRQHANIIKILVILNYSKYEVHLRDVPQTVPCTEVDK